MDSPTSYVLRNARVALADRLIEGWVAVEDGRIAGVGEGAGPGQGVDMAGDWNGGRGTLSEACYKADASRAKATPAWASCGRCALDCRNAR